MNDVAVGDELISGMDRAAKTIRTLVDDIVAERRPDDDLVRDCNTAVQTLLSTPADRAVVIGIQEEVRGLLADLIDIADEPAGNSLG